ncbi:MAG: gliding motility-associated C-terminal domain-containing protein, partial [Saprospiraceae bacterium]|nr:gliding motility-associated C-terminal domain-containing protein [Saprospiraceae bacterium]
IYPTAFTPDGDGTNDAFGPIAVPECAYAAFEWAVFNRWGERLFASSSPADAWNGRRPDGQAAPSDVYVWQLRYALLNGSERVWFVKKGDVTLMR